MLEYNWPEPRKSLNRLPHPHSCHRFIHTKHDGTHVVKRCHGDKIFDYRSLKCQNKHSAKCWMEIVKKGSMKKVKQHFSCPFPWGLYPDKEDCTLFHECMGGKVYLRKCPHSTFFDIVERICVHSSKALCAQDSGTRDRTAFHPQRLFETRKSKKDILSENVSRIFTAIAFEPSRTFGIDVLEEISEKGSIKSKNKYITSKSPFIAISTMNPKAFKTTDADSEENSSEEIREKGRTKAKNKYITSKSPFIATSTVNRKLFKTTNSDSEENSSEEVTEKGRTKSKNKYITSQTPFIAKSTVNRKSFKTTDADSEEENSSEEKGNEISSKYELKSTISTVRTSSSSTYRKEDVISISTNITKSPEIISSSQDGHSTEVPFQVSSIKPLVSTGNNLNSVKTTATLVVNKKGNTNDDENKTSLGTEIVSEELTSSVEPLSHKRIDSTTKIPFTDSPTFRSEITESIEIGSKPVTSSSILCPDFDSYLPHPNNKHLYIACVGGVPTVMKCPENLVYDSNTSSCIYDKI